MVAHRLRSAVLCGALALLGSCKSALASDTFDVLATLALPDGRTLYAGGYGRFNEPGLILNADWVFAVVRLNADGSYDTSFNKVGVALVPIFHVYEFVDAIAVQPDGKIVVAGSASTPDQAEGGCYCGQIAVARLNEDGTIDRSFNGNGRVVLNVADDDTGTYVTGVNVNPDGKIVVMGPRGRVATLDADGTSDLLSGSPSEFIYVRALVAEVYDADLDHYFLTWKPDEIEALEAKTSIKDWVRTGKTFHAYAIPRPGSSPVCRYYIPPGFGNSHFFGRDAAECAATAQANPSFVLEDAAFMYMALPSNGACPQNTAPVYRLFNNRPDANHRYTIERETRDAMVAQGWIAEGDGPEHVAMCAPD